MLELVARGLSNAVIFAYENGLARGSPAGAPWVPGR
jgi:hypothetical protein